MAEETQSATPSNALDVIVVGAGPSGLVAAYELERSGLRVCVLEARERIGGRVFSQQVGYGQYAEGGAEYFEEDQRRVNRYIDHFGLERTLLRGDYAYALLDDVLHDFKAPDKTKLPEQLSKGMPTHFYSFDIKHHFFLPLWDRVRKEVDNDEAAWDVIFSMSVAEALNDAGTDDVTRAYIRMLLAPDEGVELEDISAAELELEAWGDDYNDDLFQVKGGNARLLDAFAAALKGELVCDAKVVQVNQHKEGVTVAYEVDDDRIEVSASYVVLAIPLAPLRQISFVPALSKARQEALDAVSYATVVKVIMQFSDRPWESCGWSGDLTTDHPINVWHQTANQEGETGVLCFYAVADAAAMLRSLPSDEERRDFLLDVLKEKKLLPQDCIPIGMHVFDWASEPFSGGGWSVFPLGEEEECMEVLAAPEGRCYFAGEHIPDRRDDIDEELMDTVEAALSSGQMAARAILKLKKKAPTRWRRAILRPAGSDADVLDTPAPEVLPQREEQPFVEANRGAVVIERVVDALEDDSFWEVIGGKPSPPPPIEKPAPSVSSPGRSKEPKARPSASVFEMIGGPKK